MLAEKKKRGIKPQGKVRIEWSADFAYAIGLIASDGNLSKNGRMILFVSKDEEQIVNFCCALGIHPTVGSTYSGLNVRAFRVQVGDVLFYRFLQSIGMMPAKSKVIGRVLIPTEFFFDFMRGCFDGDGCVYSYWDKRWRSSFMFYMSLASASRVFIDWIRDEVQERLGILGHLTSDKEGTYFQLKYAKADSLVLIRALYGNGGRCLTRKRLKIEGILCIIGQSIESIGR